ncbi:MAG: Holliday junction resolvase RuvX [Spirochaetes bacterium]|nr:Holliday junction resolvase RuvX [Spirochaetota bacterium]MCK5267339.1 Holliday junction resolvase RuvX [Spirochaetota bacterium]
MYIGIDYGKSRVGIAKSDSTNTLATPLDVISVKKGFNVLFERIKDVLKKEGIAEGFVIGNPGEEDPRAAILFEDIRVFAEILTGEFGIPVYYFDEQFTSRQAFDLLLQGGSGRKKRKQMLDAASASLILQGFLDSMQ